jgi:hypothetical protein
MGRPLSQGPDIIMQDVTVLNRIIRRVMKDPKRYPHQREPLIAHLKGATTILLNGERAEDLLTNNTEVASVLRSKAKKPKKAAKRKSKKRTGK